MTLEDTLVHLARLGLEQDTRSIQRLLSKVLKEAARGKLVLGEDTRNAFANLVATQPQREMRSAEGCTTTLVSVESCATGPDPHLPPELILRIDSLIAEHEQAEALSRAGLVPTRTVLLTGPPGVGKTITARSVARRLGVPLYTVSLSALVSSLLGETAKNLRDVFAAAKATSSVLLLDEFDAIAKRRDDPSDIGELRRTVNVLLLELDAWPATSLVIAATNHPELLDRAIWRRFETTIELQLPAPDIRRAILAGRLAELRHPASPVVLDAVVESTADASAASIEQLATSCVRRAVLHSKEIDAVLVEETLQPLREAARVDDRARKLYCQVAAAHLGLTQRAIGEMLGISHVTVGNVLRETNTKRARKRRKQTGLEHE